MYVSLWWLAAGVLLGAASVALPWLTVGLIRRHGGRRVPGASTRMNRLVGTYTIRPTVAGSSFSQEHGHVLEDAAGLRTLHPLSNVTVRGLSGCETVTHGGSGPRPVSPAESRS